MNKLKWFVAVLSGAILKIFNRSRWTGGDECIDWTGLLTNCHGILGAVYSNWYQKITGRPAAVAAAYAHGADELAGLAALLDDEMPPLDEADEAADDEAAGARACGPARGGVAFPYCGRGRFGLTARRGLVLARPAVGARS